MPAKTKPETTPATAKAATGIKKLNFGGMAAVTKKPAGKEYPVVPDNEEGTISELVTVLLKEQGEFDALEGSIAIHKAELRTLATPFYFERNHDLHDVPS